MWSAVISLFAKATGMKDLGPQYSWIGAQGHCGEPYNGITVHAGSYTALPGILPAGNASPSLCLKTCSEGKGSNCIYLITILTAKIE